jgi:translation elongation factor EF-Tu-like GTPase
MKPPPRPYEGPQAHKPLDAVIVDVLGDTGRGREALVSLHAGTVKLGDRVEIVGPQGERIETAIRGLAMINSDEGPNLGLLFGSEADAFLVPGAVVRGPQLTPGSGTEPRVARIGRP